MKIEINDHEFKDAMLVGILTEIKGNLQWNLSDDNYFMEEDRFADEELLQAVNVILKNYTVQERKDEDGSE